MRHPLLNKWVIAVFLLVTLLAGGGYGLYTYVNDKLAQLSKAGPSEVAVGTVAQQKGRAWSELNSSKRLLSTGSPIYQGDRIITGRHARLILKMNDEAIIAVGEDTELVIQEYQYSVAVTTQQAEGGAPPPPNRGILDLTKGFLKATSGALAKLDQQPFAIVTPVATMGVRGTQFWGRLHYVKNEITQDEQPNLDHICMTPVCTVKNDQGEQVIEQSNLSTQVESKRKPPSNPEPTSRDMLAKAHLSTLIPPKLPQEAVQNLSNRMAAMLVEKGIANSLEAAAKIVEASLERMVEKAEWDMAEKAVNALIEEKGKITPEEIDAKLKQELPSAEYDAFKKIEQEKESSLNSLQQEMERRLQDELSAPKAAEVSKILEDKARAHEELNQDVQKRLEDLLDKDKALQIQKLKEEEQKQKEILDQKLQGELNALLPADLADKIKRLDDKLGLKQPEKLDEVLRVQINDETTYQKVKSTLENKHAEQQKLEQEITTQLTKLAGGEENLTTLQQIIKYQDDKLTAMELLANKRLKDVVGQKDFNNLLQTLGEFEQRRAEVEQNALNALKEAISPESLASIENVLSDIGQEKSVTSQEIEQLLAQPFPADILEKSMTQSVQEIAQAVGEFQSRNPDASLEDVFNAVERFLNSQAEWDEGPRTLETSREETQALEDVEETDVLDELAELDEESPDTGLDSESVDQPPVLLPTTPTTEDSTTQEAKTTETPEQPVETETADKSAEQAKGADVGASEIIVTYVKDKNTGLSLGGVYENSPSSTAVGVLSTNSNLPGDTYRFEFVGPFKDAGGRFYMTNDILYVRDSTLLNYEANTEHTITLKGTNFANRILIKDITIQVLDANEAPTDAAIKALPPQKETDIPQVVENSITLTGIASIISKDPDKSDTHTYSLSDDAGGRFKVSKDVIVVADPTHLDYESNSSHNITVRVTDKGGLTYDETFLIKVTDINEVPTDITINTDTVPENSPVGTQVGILSAVDQDFGDSASFSLLDTANGRFQVDGASLKLDGNLPFNFEGTNSFTIKVQAVDSGGLSFDKEIIIHLSDVNETPTEIGLVMDDAFITTDFPSGALPENADDGSVVGRLTTVDPDAADTFTYAFTNPLGAEASIFTITGDVLMLMDNSTLSWTSSNTDYVFSVTVTDHGEPAPLNLTLTQNVIVPLRPFDCVYIPKIPSVASMLSEGRNTYRNILVALEGAAAGETITITEQDLENLIVSKVGQQLDSFNLTDAVNKFDVQMNAEKVEVYTEVNLGGVASGLYGRVASTNTSALDLVNSTFIQGLSDLSPYSSDYKACVRFRVKPSYTTSIIMYAEASTVDVHHDVDVVPNVSLSMTEAITLYHQFMDYLALSNVRFFTTKNSYPPLHTLRDMYADFTPTGAEGLAIEREKKIRAAMAIQGRTPTDTFNDGFVNSQDVPISTAPQLQSQFIDYYFPGMISQILFNNNGTVTLTRSAN